MLHGRLHNIEEGGSRITGLHKMAITHQDILNNIGEEIPSHRHSYSIAVIKQYNSESYELVQNQIHVLNANCKCFLNIVVSQRFKEPVQNLGLPIVWISGYK